MLNIILVVLAIGMAVSAIVQFWPLLVILVAGWLAALAVLQALKHRYFSSEQFRQVKEEIASVVSEHNEIAEYVKEISAKRSFTLGKSKSGMHAHLADSRNTSSWGYRRDKNVAEYGSEMVHNAGLQVVRNAAADPIKYLMKYFDIPPTEEKLEQVEELGESLSRLEGGLRNIKRREAAIAEFAAPPKFITRFFLREFQEKIGLSIPKIEIPFPIYKFQYVSAGGNSSQETKITLDSRTLDSLIETMAEKIKFRKSAAGQRALMTASLRESIKQRDSFTCKYCSLSLKDEPNLLLEVDHIKPVSKGGLSVEENLQTLCWRCNRAKSNKDHSPRAS